MVCLAFQLASNNCLFLESRISLSNNPGAFRKQSQDVKRSKETLRAPTGRHMSDTGARFLGSALGAAIAETVRQMMLETVRNSFDIELTFIYFCLHVPQKVFKHHKRR